MKPLLKRFGFLIAAIAAVAAITLFDASLGFKAVNIAGFSLKEMLLVLPPVFVLMGLLDVWVPKEIMIRYMGEGSGVKGIALAILLGSAAAGPLYGAFPVAAVFMRKEVKFTNILIFIGAWSTTKIPMFVFEMSALGTAFAVTRLLVDIPGIIIIAYALAALIPKEEIKALYKNAENL